jgi:hypothetical protein
MLPVALYAGEARQQLFLCSRYDNLLYCSQ